MRCLIRLKYINDCSIIQWSKINLAVFLEFSDKKVNCSSTSCETQTDFDIYCAKCTEPIENNDTILKPNLSGGKLRVKNEFKLRIQTNGNQEHHDEDNEECMDEDDIDEDEERYAAIMAAAEESDDDDDGKIKCWI